MVQEYLRESEHPYLPLTRITQEQNCLEFNASFDDQAAVSDSYILTNVKESQLTRAIFYSECSYLIGLANRQAMTCFKLVSKSYILVM